MRFSVAATGTRIAGRFVVEALAGAGGMGAVYRAHDEQNGQRVALKLLQVNESPGDAERFAREAALLSRLRHPNIVSYVAHGVAEIGVPYLAMEWLSGEDLTARLGRGELSLEDSLTLLRCAAEALAVAHKCGVVHRDLKPSNLFLRDGRVERIAILDFGIARQTAPSYVITRSGMVLGTPSYMAPEQARGEQELTPASDVFSLGCVLFECLTGQPPFVAEQVLAVLAKVLFEEPPRLREVRPEIPAEVDALLARMLAKDTKDRLPDATAILAAIDAMKGLPLTATLVAGGVVRRSRRADIEQHLISVLIATPPADLGGAPASPAAVTFGSPINDGGLAPLPPPQAIEGLHSALVAHGARVEVLANGALVATLAHARGAATDQAAQAARCALVIKARWPEATIALSTGCGLLKEHLPVGDVLDRAASLLRDRPAVPPPSEQILLDTVTRGLLEVRFLTHRTASGRYALTGEEPSLDASRTLLGKPTPCVGRDVEISMLESSLSGCIEDCEPRAMLVTGAPGAGKSRLRHELLRRMEARVGDNLLILIGRGDPMSTGSAYGLLGQALRRLCGIQVGESLEVRRKKLALRVGQHLPEAERGHAAAFIGELCGVPFPDEDDVKLRAARQDRLVMSDQITQAMLDFLRAECAERPMLLVLEDLHWGDALTAKLLDTMLRRLKDCPLMVLALARPEVAELFPRLWSGVVQVLALLPMGKKAGERLVHQVLGKEIPKAVVARIVEQSEGNALFLEELIRAVAEGRGDEAPETVLAMLQARIGRLPAGARRVLRAASVFGDTSWPGGLRALLGSSDAGHDLEGWLSRLTQDEILEERRESCSPEEQAYRFRHALMRDAAYGLLTADDRAESHRIAGQYLEARGEKGALVLAEHFLHGQQPMRAVPYFLQAAEQSHETNDMDATLASAERGLSCGAEGDQRGALLSLQAAVYLGRERYAEVITLGTAALALLPPGGRSWCRAFHCLFPAATMTQKTALLAELAPRFARVEPSADGRGEYVRAAAWLSVALSLTGRPEESRVFLQRAQEVGAALDRSDVSTWAYLKAGEANDHHLIEEAPWSCLVGNIAGREALQTAGERRTRIIVSAHHGKALMELGDQAGAEADLRETLSLAMGLNEALPLAYARTYLARVLAATAPLEKLDEPTELARDVIAAKNMSLIGVAHGVLAEIKRRQGDLAGAEAEARAACDAVRPFPPMSWDLIALRMQILLEQGRTAEALPMGEEALARLELLRLAGHGELELRLALVEARHAAGKLDAARALLAETIPRLKKRVDDIPDGAARARYVREVPTNARLFSRALAWLGAAAVDPSRLGL